MLRRLILHTFIDVSDVLAITEAALSTGTTKFLLPAARAIYVYQESGSQPSREQTVAYQRMKYEPIRTENNIEKLLEQIRGTNFGMRW